jgi:hypothetical protein
VAVKTKKRNAGARRALKTLTAADGRVSFGPLFFMQNLRGLVRDRCPVPEEAFPSVQIHLLDGDVLDVCHIIGIAPHWIALAVHEVDRPDHPAQMRTEMVPYHLIGRVSIQTNKHEGSHPIGFNTQLEPEVYGGAAAAAGMSPEEALQAVAGVTLPAPPKARGVAPRGSRGTR